MGTGYYLDHDAVGCNHVAGLTAIYVRHRRNRDIEKQWEQEESDRDQYN